MVKKPKQLLFAPLDWGMGHTTRCIPIIRYLQSLGHQVTFAGNEAQCALIQETAGADTVHLDGYNVTYSKKGSTFALHLLLQVPRIIFSIKKENKWLKNLLTTRHFDSIISDNRYGLYAAGIPTVIMTHQLRIQTGLGNAMNSILQGLHYRLLRRFTERWVPDVPHAPGLAGSLSHPATLPAKTHYIGLLSQLQQPKPAPATNTLLVLLSGPEPQRTILSDILWAQVAQHSGKVVFVEGKASAERRNIPAHITWYPKLATAQLQLVIEQAAVVICRSGYSTIMDLVLMNKKAILVPTPGQAEQEYLAEYLSAAGYFYSVRQHHFSLCAALKKVEQTGLVTTGLDNAFSSFIPVIDEWLLNLD